MSVITTLSIDADEFVLGEVLAPTTTRIELTQFVPVDGQLVPYFWKEHDGDLEPFERSVRDHPAVAALVNLDGRADSDLYRIEWTDEVNGFLTVLRDRDVLIEKASTADGGSWFFRLRALGRDEFSALQRACHDRGISLDIRRVIDTPGISDESRSLAGVTPKQREALRLALDSGYFEVPRNVSAADLGAELGISGQAFARRLQRGHRSILTNLLADQPA